MLRSLSRGWLATHACWVASAGILIVGGIRWQDCSSSERGGPFVAGYHPTAVRNVEVLMAAGFVGSLFLGVAEMVAARRGHRTGDLALVNLPVALWAVVLVGFGGVALYDSPQFCSPRSVLLVLAAFSPSFVGALVANNAAWRRVSISAGEGPAERQEEAEYGDVDESQHGS